MKFKSVGRPGAKPFHAKAGTVWLYTGRDGKIDIFVLLEGYLTDLEDNDCRRILVLHSDEPGPDYEFVADFTEGSPFNDFSARLA